MFLLLNNSNRNLSICKVSLMVFWGLHVRWKMFIVSSQLLVQTWVQNIPNLMNVMKIISIKTSAFHLQIPLLSHGLSKILIQEWKGLFWYQNGIHGKPLTITCVTSKTHSISSKHESCIAQVDMVFSPLLHFPISSRSLIFFPTLVWNPWINW